MPAIGRQLMTRDLALPLDEHYEANKVIIEDMTNGFCVAIGLLAVEIICLPVGLWLH
jgi:hypothetical protein